MTAEQIVRAVNQEYEILQNPFELHEALRFLLTRNIHNVLEIGVYGGGSFACWHMLAQAGKCIFVDHPKVAEEIQSERARKLQRYSDVYPIIADSHLPETVGKVEKILNGELLDFLFIDGDHTYEACKQDYQLYKHLVNPNKGVIGFHDINQSEQTKEYGADAYRFWNEVTGNKITISAGMGWCGIGLLILDPSPPITWILKAQ